MTNVYRGVTFPINFYCQCRHSAAQTTRSYPRRPQRPTLCTALREISHSSKAPNHKQLNRRPRRVWKRKGRWWISLVTTMFLSCSPKNNLHPPARANNCNSKRRNRKLSNRRLKFNNNRFLHLFVIRPLHQNVIAHLITYHLILI